MDCRAQVAADTSLEVVTRLLRARKAYDNELQENIGGATELPESVASLVISVDATLLEAKELILASTTDPLVAKILEINADLTPKIMTWTTALDDNWAWLETLKLAKATILTKDVKHYKDYAEALDILKSNVVNALGIFDELQPAVLKTATDTIIELKKLYAENLFCSIFDAYDEDNDDDESKAKRKKSVHKVMTYVKTIPLAWDNMPSAIKTRADLAKQLQ
jgi:hypothetical protein